MAEALPLAEDDYPKFYEINEPVINLEGGVNEIQHIQRSMMEVPEEQTKDEVLSEVYQLGRNGTAAPEGGNSRQSTRSLSNSFHIGSRSVQDKRRSVNVH